MVYTKDVFKIEEVEADMGLPELTGSKKQVEWATHIRVNMLLAMKYLMENAVEVSQEDFEEAKNDVSASNWIDNRHFAFHYIEMVNEHFFSQDFPEKYLYFSENREKEGFVDILHGERIVYYHYRYDRDFRRIMKGKHYVPGAWYENEGALRKTARMLLSCGFSINSDRELNIPRVTVIQDLLDEDD